MLSVAIEPHTLRIDDVSSRSFISAPGLHMRPIILSATLLLAGCATIVEGASQTITVDVVPSNGVCEVHRQGELLGVSTPEKRVVTVSKSQHDLMFTCTAPGYRPKTESLSSVMSGMTVASFFLLDLGIVDAATGAWKKYPPKVVVVLDR